MKDLFIPHKQALALKELGFDESCFGYYRKGAVVGNPFEYNIDYCTKVELDHGLSPKNSEFINDWVTAPLYQQVFRWFREKHKLKFYIRQDRWNHWCSVEILNKEDYIDIGIFESYEESELACLKKLIEIVNLENK
jgi:hypothetical protein